MSRRALLALGSIAGFCIMIIPFPSMVVPVWTVRVVDTEMRPLSGVSVEQSWKNYSLQVDSRYEERISNADGFVSFPRRDVWAPLSWRVLGPILSTAAAGVHAGYGSSALLVAVLPRPVNVIPEPGSLEGSLSYRPDRPLETLLILRPWPPEEKE